MRFGIMVLQLSALLPSGLPPAEILPRLATFDQAELAGKLARQGFDPIELGGDLALFLPHTFDAAAIQRLAKLQAESGLRYTVHLPLWSVEPSTPLNPVRQGSLQALVDCIQATQALQIECYVLHATGSLAAEFYRMTLPETARALILRQFQNGARETIRQLLAQTGIASRKLAIETIEFPFDLTLELAEELDCSICFDTGHVLVGFSGPVDLFEALERCLPRLAEVHLHDGPWQGPQLNIGYGKDHQPLGAGDLDVGRLLDRLAAANFKGPVVFELRVDQALESLEHIRHLRPNTIESFVPVSPPVGD